MTPPFDRRVTNKTCSKQLLQVIFPVLEELEICGLPNITEIWEKQSLSVQDKAESSAHEKLINDFSKLRGLEITDMKNLKSFCTNSKISKSQPLFNHQVHMSLFFLSSMAMDKHTNN